MGAGDSGRPGRRGAFVLAFCVFCLSCVSIPRDPEAPTADELVLVELAQDWCAEQGSPAGTPEKPFSTDVCSLWPDGSLTTCCVTHDIAYWCGGTAEQRLAADRELGECADEVGYWSGTAVFLGVRVGGVPWLPTAWRWGYGHGFGSGYVDSTP